MLDRKRFKFSILRSPFSSLSSQFSALSSQLSVLLPSSRREFIKEYKEFKEALRVIKN